MYKTKVTEAKRAAVQSLKDNFSGVNDFIFTDYRGLSVGEITKLRRALRELSAEYYVVKNRHAEIALRDLEYPALGDFLTGPTAVALAQEESAPVAKEIINFSKDSSLSVKGALIDGKILDLNDLEAFSKLPGRLELIAQLMGTMNAPIQSLTFALNAVSTKLVRTLQALAEQKSA
ncbi:MAG: 50S ribosomal protein L10 [Salinispira sp.]